MYFKGKVTKIDFKYCRFTLENEITIYAGLYYSKFTETEIEFPDVNTLVVIEEETAYNKILFPKKIMCQSVCSRQQTELCLPFINLLKQCNLQLLDMISIVKIAEKIQNEQIFSLEFLESINWCQNFSFIDIIFKLTPFFSNIAPNLNFDESNYKILTPNAHKLENGKHIDLVKWNFGVNNFKNTEYLIGYLEVSSDMGYIVLRDSKHYLICQIAPDNRVKYSEKMTKLLNNFVVIKNYYIFTEHTKSFGSIQYVFVSINDVDSLEQRTHKQIENIVEGINVKIKVINRCSVTYNPSNDSLDCLVHCFIELQEVTKECFIQLCGKHFAKYPLFNTDDIYVLSTKTPYFVDQMAKFKSNKYLKINNINIPVFVIPPDGILNLLSSEVPENNSKLLSISEVKKVIEENLEFQRDERDIRGFERNYFKQKPDNKLISFEAVIKKRNTLGPDKYAQKPVKNPHFGIRGPDTHQLYFKFQKFDSEVDETMENVVFYLNDDLKEAEQLYAANKQPKSPEKSQEGLSLYLFNFRLLQTPLGLVENMKVAVRYVSNPKDKKYFKPCLFTSIEPLEYVPSKDFDTTPELIGNLNWGPPAPLGDSSHIPGTCLVWGKTLSLQITVLNINLRCTKCKDIFYPNQEICCGIGLHDGSTEGPKLDITLGMKGTDYSGPFDTICKEETVLKNILGLREHNWMVFKKALFGLKHWTSNSRETERIQDIIQDQRTIYQESLGEFLSIFVTAFNEMGFHNFDLKCRKMYKTELDLLEKWYLVEARPSVVTKSLNMTY